MTNIATDPPPLLFSPRSPSPASFNSQRQHPSSYPTPNLTSFQPTSLPQPQPESGDVDMSMSITLPPPGQNHDRDINGAQMDIEEPVAVDIVEAVVDSAGQTATGSPNSSLHSHEVNDAMDTSPDQGQLQPAGVDLARADGTAELERDDWRAAQDPAAGSAIPSAPAPIEQPIPPTGLPPELPIGEPISLPGASRSPSLSANNANQESSDDRDSSPTGATDEDEDLHPPWHELKEDTSWPSQDELKEIESEAEPSALDHEHWQSQTFFELSDPEYSAGESGTIHWTINNFNGTKQKPNKELMMVSDVVEIGGYAWQLKFYPRGMNNDYLSVFLKCVSMESKSASRPSQADSSQRGLNVETLRADSALLSSAECALEPLDGCGAARRRGVSAQGSIILYNPAEPRVNVFRSFQHLFCQAHDDWGFERFYGPWYEIQHRRHGQRQALLRNDTLAFTAHVRIVHDETGCLYEHSTASNPWNSQEIVGLQSLAMSPHPRSMGDGNIISALSMWLMLPPFRALIYQLDIPETGSGRERPLLEELSVIVYMMRSPGRNKTSSPHVSLEGVVDALQWYGIKTKLEDLDVVQVWHILRRVLERELQDLPQARALEAIFGPSTDAVARPSFRIPAKSTSSVQIGLANSVSSLPSNETPHVLTVEIERQHFNANDRSWSKLLDKVSLDDTVDMHGTSYTLFGLVAHKGTLQSDRYHSIIRPRGPGGKWYNFRDSRDDNIVECLTKRDAVDAHEGTSDGASVDEIFDKIDVAYLVTYLRSDLLVIGKREPEWNVPNWVKERGDKERAPPPVPTSNLWGDVPPEENAMHVDGAESSEAASGDATGGDSVQTSTESFEVEVLYARAIYQNHVGPGIWPNYTAYFEDAQRFESKPSVSVRLSLSDSKPEKIWRQVATAAGLKPSQCRIRVLGTSRESMPSFWPLEKHSLIGEPDSRPMLSTSEQLPISAGPEYLNSVLWLHAIDPTPNDEAFADGQDEPLVDESKEILFFLKVFDAENQSLKVHGSYVEQKATRVDKAVAKLLGTSTSADNVPELFWEKELNLASPIPRRRTFTQESLPDACIVIAAPRLTDEKKIELQAKGCASTVQEYLEMESHSRNFPESFKGNFEFNYFGSEYYKGGVVAGYPHGHGTKVALDGSKYTGEFALGARHGEGFLEYKNGDTYRGHFVDDVRDGQGTFTEAETGNVYEGGWRKDKRFGEGVARYKRAQGMIRVPECKICYEEDADCFFVDCGHVVACKACAARLDACPVCRRKVLRVSQLQFTVGC